MLEITIPECSKYDERSEEFVHIKQLTLKLEHSLLSVKKWEAKWHKPFLNTDDKTEEEILDYVSCMTLNREKVDSNVYRVLSPAQLSAIIEYIQNPMTATWFSDNKRIGASNRTGEVVTAEIIYYWMISLRVPIELEKWHLNQLLTLLKVINVKNGGEKKMSKRETMEQMAALNRKRRAKYKSKG